jgi:hypothetical protein
MRNSGWTDGIGLDALQYGLGEHAVDRSPERQREKRPERGTNHACSNARNECEDELDTKNQDEQ